LPAPFQGQLPQRRHKAPQRIGRDGAKLRDPVTQRPESPCLCRVQLAVQPPI